MDLNTEQMSCVYGSPAPITWEPVELPTGRQQMPSWLRKAWIEWGDGWANSPWFRVEHDDAYHWPDQKWREHLPGCFLTTHDDGRASALWHRGTMTPGWVWNLQQDGKPRMWLGSWQLAENEAQAQAAATAWIDKITSEDPRSLHPVVRHAIVSERQGGFGGSHYMLPMEDGTWRLLRGPWSGGPPPGFVEPLCHGMLMMTEDLFLRIVAHYTPHVGVARVKYPYGTFLEVYNLQQGRPKKLVYDEEHARASNKMPAGEHASVYWGDRTPLFGVKS